MSGLLGPVRRRRLVPVVVGLVVLPALAVLAAATVPFQPAGAAGKASTVFPSSGNQTPSWSFVPYDNTANVLARSAIHLVAKPGQTISTTAVLTNYSTDTLYFDIYGSDAYNTVKLGAFTLNPPNAPRLQVGKWVSVPVNNYDLPPKTSADFHFSVHVPPDASPGDHAGGIVALNLAQPAKNQSGTNLDIQRGEGIAIYVRVPGPRHPGVAATDIGATTSTPAIGFGSSSARVHYQVVNTGNVMLNGKVQAEAVNLWGSVVEKFKPVAIDELIPGQRMTVDEPVWDGLPFAGPVHIKLTMTTSAVNGTAESTFWVVPWLLALLIVLAIVALIGLWIWRRRRRSHESPPPDAGGEPDRPDAHRPSPEGDAPSRGPKGPSQPDQTVSVR